MPKPRLRTQARRRNLAVEAVEPRCLLSTLTVTDAADAGKGTLRAEVALAQPGDTIQFAKALDGRTITLTSGPIALNQSVNIVGPGASKLTISSGGNGRAFLETAGAAEITGVTITGGVVTAPDQGLPYAAGGAILVTGGSLGLAGDVLSGDSVSYAAGLAEGAPWPSSGPRRRSG